jgi:ribosomal protein L30/L7E
MTESHAPKKAPAKKAHHDGTLAVVLIRGLIGSRHDVRKTLLDLRLRRKMICVLMPDSPANRGRLRLCKDFIAYGPVSEETISELKAKRREIKEDGKGVNVFPMNPPRGGFGHKGTKVGYQDGGCLGYRAEGMNTLLARMM